MTDALAATRADILAAFNVTEADLTLIDNAPGLREATAAYAAEREAFTQWAFRHCTRCGHATAGWWGDKPGQHVVIDYRPLQLRTSAPSFSDDTVTVTAEQRVKFRNCLDTPATTACTDEHHRFRPGEKSCQCGSTTWTQHGDRIDVIMTVDGRTLTMTYPWTHPDPFPGL